LINPNFHQKITSW